ncbi:MAG: hypothetical protein RML72_04190 [Bacteroidia bacterium]|nr:hypothetical protein [Bacteroidia bacterium]MDW8158063.1 hypothetical protein [Bacteroidia bacterium]
MEPLIIVSISISGVLLILLTIGLFQLRNLHKIIEEKNDTLFAHYRHLEQKQEAQRMQIEEELRKIEFLVQETQKLIMREVEALGHHITQNQVQQTHQIDQTIKKAISDLEATITAPLL